jgi:integrase
MAGPDRSRAEPGLYKPVIVSYRLKNGSYRTPDGKRVTRRTPGAVRSVTSSKKWYGRYTEGGRPVRVPLSESKETARRMLAKLKGDAQLASVGITDRFAQHRARALLDHLADFRRYLAAHGNTKGHVSKTHSRAKAVIDGAKFETLDDLEATTVVEFLADLRSQRAAKAELNSKQEWYRRAELAAVLGINRNSVARMLRRLNLTGEGKGKARRYSRETVAAVQEQLRDGAGIATSNHYLTAVKGFTRWLARNRRIAADPLAHLERLNAEGDVRRPRRALREDVFLRFVETTGAGKPFRRLTGPDRLVLYTLAANTGFRANELASLTPAAFDLQNERPTVTVRAGYSKRRREDEQPLRADVAEMFRQYMAGKPKKQPLWPGTWPDVAAEMIRVDLAAVGIPYQDDDGRYFDFHAMRGQFISFLAARGVHPKVAQTLARHSTITLTMDYYTHLDVLDVSGALEKLPPAPGQWQAVPPKNRGRNPAADGKARARRSAATA